MALNNLDIKKEYRNLQCDVIKDFYIPILKEAVIYKRAVGFFSSSALYEIAIGLKALVENNGKIQLIVSPKLSEQDIKDIELGYKKREEIIEQALLKEIHEPQTQVETDKLNLLANLIAENFLDIKVAFKVKKDEIGIFHEKIGIISDSLGNRIAFTGSMNETYSGFALNYESIDVYCSWRNEDTERVELKEIAFDNLWNNVDDAVDVIDFPKVAIDKLNLYKIKDTTEISIPEKAYQDNLRETTFFKLPSDVELFEYQERAIKNWIGNDCRGIFDMATGTGKTYTALGSLCALSKLNNEKLGVIIVCPYQHLVEQWVEDIERFNVIPIVAYSSGNRKNWKELFSDCINAYRSNVRKNFCIVTTNATFATDNFQNLLRKLKKNICIVVDEAHNFGATQLSTLLPDNCIYRLALSATIERFHDEEGTEKLFSFFGDRCITVSLDDAIRQGFLTGYYYYPVLVELNEKELEEYKKLTHRISKLSLGSKDNEEKQEQIKLLLLKRARIVAGAHNKIDKLLEIIAPYSNDNHMLVYCGATKYDRTDIDDSGEVKQIEEITQRLNQTYGMKVRKFTAEESRDERIIIKEQFKEGVDLQVITAIKCLDEGVNIPAIKRAFILASSTNPKEYIQRRGRVLRKYDDKKYSEIFDFITLPRPLQDVYLCSDEEKKMDLTLIKKEFNRMMDFANSALKSYDVDELKESILTAYGVYNLDSEEEY
jgi:superfamily II DNA or RNA helicase